jgi:dTDP-4-dehydrorhamnose reductase
MVGANFAVQLAEHFDVSACFFETPRQLAGCQAVVCDPGDAQSVMNLFADLRPQRLVYCGAAANSAWDSSAKPSARDVQQAEHWLRAAKLADVSLTVVSSDAIFTGPWMFHAENSKSLCPSAEATFLRTIEQMAQDAIPESLIVRTNAFGWGSPWLSALLADDGTTLRSSPDCIRHASPILVNDLIDLVAKSWSAGLDGVYHVGGAERVNPAAFTQRFASEFALKIPKLSSTESLTNRASGFGGSETSLQTRKLRRALGISVPLLNEGLHRLRQLSLNGFRERLGSSPQKFPPSKAA